MELEEQILHAAVLVSALGVVLPWFGEQQGSSSTLWTGFGFYTAYLGTAVFLLQMAIVALTLSPMLSGPILVRRRSRNYARLVMSVLGFVLLMATLSVLLRVTYESPSANIRFGIIVSIIGSGVGTLYSYLRYHQQMKSQVQELFHHPDEVSAIAKRVTAKAAEEEAVLPPPPPPTPPPAEDHHHSLMNV